MSESMTPFGKKIKRHTCKCIPCQMGDHCKIKKNGCFET